jgi:hypothetical protein
MIPAHCLIPSVAWAGRQMGPRLKPRDIATRMFHASMLGKCGERRIKGDGLRLQAGSQALEKGIWGWCLD